MARLPRSASPPFVCEQVRDLELRAPAGGELRVFRMQIRQDVHCSGCVSSFSGGTRWHLPAAGDRQSIGIVVVHA
jgi:hypothetical protein